MRSTLQTFTKLVQRCLHRAWRCIGPGTAVSLAWMPMLMLPFAFGGEWMMRSLDRAPVPVVKPIELPVFELRTPAESVAAFGARLEQVFGLSEQRAELFADWILEASTRHDLEPEVLASLIYTESSFRKQVSSWAGAIGPAQVKPQYWRDFCGGLELTDPEHNVYCGAQVLAYYRERCGDLECALRLYNVGPGNLRLPQYQKASTRYLVRIQTHRSLFEDSTVL